MTDAMLTDTTTHEPQRYTAPATSAEIVVDALERIITGRPLPESLTPAPARPARPFSEWL